jgi:hypothetical protein
VPLAFTVFDDKHMVGDIPSKNEVVEINLLQAGLCRLLNLYLYCVGCHNAKNLVFKTLMYVVVNADFFLNAASFFSPAI